MDSGKPSGYLLQLYFCLFMIYHAAPVYGWYPGYPELICCALALICLAENDFFRFRAVAGYSYSVGMRF